MRITILFLCLFLSLAVVAQKPVQYTMTKEQLEAKKKEIQDAIKETEEQLETVKNKKGSTLAELRVLQNKLAERQRLIDNINDQLGDIESTIKSSSKEVVTLKQKLEQLKIRYAQSIRYAYETRSSYDMLAFLFSSSDFNDAMRRMKYLKKFRDYRKQQVDQIHLTQTQLQHKIGTLNLTKEELVNAQKEKVQQTQQLKQETDQKNQVVQELKGKESELMRSIENNRKIAGRINGAIQHYIEMEMEKAAKEAAAEEERRKRAEAVAKANVTKANVTKTTTPEPETSNVTKYTPKAKPIAVSAPELLLTPTDVALASSFEGNKGRMYWPVEKGYIIDKFGQHPHPLEQKVMIDNYGVDIQTSENAEVRTVYDGTISKVFSTMGSAQSVMIKHGNYFTVYNNLETVFVKEGQHVSTKQGIGKVANNDENLPVVNFQIWKWNGKKSNVKLNPELWLGKAH